MTRGTTRAWLRRQLEPEVVRRRVHAGALAAVALFAGVAAVALFRPGRYAVGPVTVRLESPGNPLLELGAALLAAFATAGRSARLRRELSGRARSAWSATTVGSRLFAAVLAAKVVVTGIELARSFDREFARRRAARAAADEPPEATFARDGRYAQLERFFERCRRELPPDARVLYTGRAEGQLLAYVLYPRPVFMHPSDRYVAWVGHQVLDLGLPLPDDPLFPGAVPPPLAPPSLDAFVAEHRITHEVRFVESDLRACRVGAIR